MKRIYAFRWHKTKDREPLETTTFITLSDACGQTEIDAKRALNVFISYFGNLKKITVKWIKELDENNIQIGEDIVPTADTNIIPERK